MVPNGVIIVSESINYKKKNITLYLNDKLLLQVHQLISFTQFPAHGLLVQQLITDTR